MTKPKLILASASPDRLKLLQSVGLDPDMVDPANIDETPHKGEPPKDFVLRVAQEKAQAIARKHEDAFIIAADTIAAAGRRIIGKAEDERRARETLELLSGRRHKVFTGVCIIAPDKTKRTRRVETTVKFKSLENKELDTYLASGEWQNKSGCYGIQSRAGGFIESINGSFSNVVGLPLVETRNMLYGLGFKE